MSTTLTRRPPTPRWLLDHRGWKQPRPRVSWAVWAAPAALLVATLVLAGCLYARFLDVHRALWDNPIHDRGAHYLCSLKLATDARNGEVLSLLNNLNEGRVWPPLHGVLAAVVLLVGGLDYRLAVLPSLAGWVVTVVFGFLVARRAAPAGGTLAGLIAALFIAASPAHRAYATDIMLESLGAGLSLVVLYAYLLTVQGREEESWKGRFLALALSALFLEKYNYWLLVVLALLAAELWARPNSLPNAIRTTVMAFDWRRWTVAQLRHPLIAVLAALALLVGYVFYHGDQPFIWAGHRVSLYPPHNLIHAGYAIVFLRLAVWWWRNGRRWVNYLDARVRQVVCWHVCPIAVWLLLPKHVSYFLWYLSLGNRTPDQHIDVAAGIRDYAGWLIHDYHPGVAATLMAVGLCSAGFVACRRVRRGGEAILLLAVLAAVLTVAHPNHKGRMLHSWVAAGWVTAGLGAAALVHGRGTARWPRLRPWLGGAVVAGLASMQYPALIESGHSIEGGSHPQHPCLLDVTDAYLADLDDASRVAVLTAVPLKPQVQWTFLERYGSFDRLDEHWYGFGSSSEDNRHGFLRWLAATDCDTLVYCARIGSRQWGDAGPECRLHGELDDLVRSQRVFHLVKQVDFPSHACRVQVWKRAPGEKTALRLAEHFHRGTRADGRINSTIERFPSTLFPSFRESSSHESLHRRTSDLLAGRAIPLPAILSLPSLASFAWQTR